MHSLSEAADVIRYSRREFYRWTLFGLATISLSVDSFAIGTNKGIVARTQTSTSSAVARKTEGRVVD
jgi:hypothetical protein